MHNLKKNNTPRNLAIATMLECSELLEHFQWKNDDETEKYVQQNKEEIGKELADIANYVFEFSDKIGIDLKKEMLKKIKLNSEKYKKQGKIQNR